MKGNKTGKQLYKYYQKEVDSILINLNEIKESHSPEEIHRLRVDIKKIKALFHLFEKTVPEKFNANKPDKIFNNIFRQAGKIREAQINQIYIDQFKLPVSKILLYKQFYHEKEKKCIKKFDKIVARFNSKRVIEIDNEIKKMSRNISKDKLIDRMHKFIFDKIDKIMQMTNHSENEVLHKVRKSLQSVSAIAMLLNNIHSSKELEKSLDGLKKVEKLIGSWHDCIVFRKSLNEFLNDSKLKPDKELIVLMKLSDKLVAENEVSSKAIMKKIQLTLTGIKNK